MAGTGTANVSLSDPPSCTNQFKAVYVTITGVMAHTSASAPPNAAGWQNLASPTQLSLTVPMQVNLFNLNSSSTGECLLKKLGSTQSLPEGSYQQIRLILADNGGGTSPTGNVCAGQSALPSGTVNCVEDNNGVWYPLELSSQDVKGLKIPPGQIVGGPITVGSGQTVDININFNTCASLVYDPANQAYRLNPTLTASQVQPNSTGISGTVYSATSNGGTNFTTMGALGDATVKLEMPGGGPSDAVNPVPNGGASTDDVVDSAITDSAGNFYFCPLNQDAVLDVVADAPAQTSSLTPAAVSGVTIIQTVAGGAKINVPVITEGGSPTEAGTYSVTVQQGTNVPSGAFTVDEDLVPLQFTVPSPFTATGGYEFIAPPLNGSDGLNGAAAQALTINCPGGSSGATCTVANVTNNTPSILVPATDPLVGTYSSTSKAISWVPGSGPTFSTGVASMGYFAIEGYSAATSPTTCDATAGAAFTQQAQVTAGQTTPVTITLSNCQ